MGSEVANNNRDSIFHGDYAGRDLNVTNILMLEDKEREFVVTHNANIKPVYYFIGREVELQDLRQSIEEGRKSVLVSGMGGIGKTHICRKLFEEYINKHAKGENIPFFHIGYIEYNGDMGSSLQNCLKYKEQDNPEQNQKAAWKELEYLAADGKLLLFVDNVNVPIGDDVGLRRLKSIPGAVVLTSRRTSFSKEFEPYKIDFLSTEQCKKIYESIRYDGSGKKMPEEEIPDMEYIIEKLAAKHTITIEFLANLAQTKHWTVKRLREELESKGFRLEYKDEEDRLVNIQESYETLYDLSALTESELNILEAFSVFPYIPLAAGTCNEWLFADAGVSEDDDILTGLYRKGWLQFDTKQESYVLHPVFAQFIYEKSKPRMNKHFGLVKSCQKSLEIPEDGSVLECQKYISFAENIIEKIDGEKRIDRDSFIFSLAYSLQYIGEYKKAERLYEKILKICKDVLGEYHLDTALVYNNLAMVCISLKEYKKAKKLQKKSLQICKNVLGKDHPDTAAILNGLAIVYKQQGNYEKAKEFYEKSLQIYEKTPEESSLNIAVVYQNLSVIYGIQEKYKKWEVTCKKSLDIYESVRGKDHPNTAKIYNNLARGYEEQGKYKIALDYYLKSYKILVYKLGLNHPITQDVYKNIEWVYSGLNLEGNFEQWLEEKMKE